MYRRNLLLGVGVIYALASVFYSDKRFHTRLIIVNEVGAYTSGTHFVVVVLAPHKQVSLGWKCQSRVQYSL
jgi:hypothetical protein